MTLAVSGRFLPPLNQRTILIMPIVMTVLILFSFIFHQFSLFMSEAVLMFSPHLSPIKKLTQRTKSRFHWILQGLCVSCAFLGIVAIYYNKHLNGKPHFTSWHGVLGVMTLWLTVLQLLAALPLLYHSLAKGWSLAKLKQYHAATGMATYLLGSISLVLGLSSAWVTTSVKGYMWYLIALCPVL